MIRVVDWDNAQVVPAGSAIQHPLSIADIPGWVNDGRAGGETFEEDRLYLEQIIESLHDEPTVGTKLRRLLETSHDRQFLELSLRNKRINAEYGERILPQTSIQQSTLQLALDGFLSRHEEMKSDHDILRIHQDLSRVINK